tara:strand:- start:1685 stop:1909 length:225 start_codon:yes stop_codon:yes gene_type:complete
MAEKLTEVFEQDGERFNPKAFHSITEEQSFERFGHVYSKTTLTAVWKRSNGFSVKKKTASRPNLSKKVDSEKEG